MAIRTRTNPKFTYGLRNPFRFDVAGTAAQPIVYVGDVGWTQWEEINAGIGGENFGWPAFEGGNGTSLETGGYRDLAEVQDYYATNPDVEAPIWARLHSDGARAIVMGDTVSSAYGGAYEGSLIFTDIGDTTLRAVNFDSAGNVSNVEIVSQSLGFIVDIQTGPDGLLYYVDITGSIGRLDFVIA
jgi:glucose/arabinose dehydrogenase